MCPLEAVFCIVFCMSALSQGTLCRSISAFQSFGLKLFGMKTGGCD